MTTTVAAPVRRRPRRGAAAADPGLAAAERAEKYQQLNIYG
jgi:hypothetical protein